MNQTELRVEIPATLREKLFGIVAYLSWCSPFGFFAPLILYFWKGKASRFVGFHAVQSALLGLALMLVMLVVGLVALVLAVVLGRLGMAAFWVMSFVLAMLPLCSCLWMAFSVLVGRGAVLPVLGRWAREITASPSPSHEAAHTPHERVFAGASYLAILMPLTWVWLPIAPFYWRGKRSAFIAFHGAQALVVDIAMVPALGAAWYLALHGLVVLEQKGHATQTLGNAVLIAMFCASLVLPLWLLLGLAVRVMRGRAAVLPVLGRLAGWIARTGTVR